MKPTHSKQAMPPPSALGAGAACLQATPYAHAHGHPTAPAPGADAGLLAQGREPADWTAMARVLQDYVLPRITARRGDFDRAEAALQEYVRRGAGC